MAEDHGDPTADGASAGRVLGKRETQGYSGGETLFGAEIHAPDASILSFWQWAYSDLTDNVNRGIFAEWMVAKLLEVRFPATRQPWDVYDLVTPEGIRVEVKASAYVHSWSKAGPQDKHPQPKPARIEFTNLCAHAYTDATMTHVADATTYNADVYVFCCQTSPDAATWSALDLDQWEFYALSKPQLEEHGWRSIALGTLRRLTSAVPPGELRAAVQQAAGMPTEES